MYQSTTRRPARRITGARHFGPSRNTRRKSNKQFINPSRFIKPARAVEAEEYQPTHTFEDFAVHPVIKQNIAAKGFKTPSKIQDVAIPHGLAGKDVVGIANTGTGKTTAFAVPVIHKLLEDKNSRAVIIAPTRELADQIRNEIFSLNKGCNMYSALLIGGTSMFRQVRDLQRKPHIIIGTPGRMKDHIERGNLDLSTVNTVVLDEVDRMVDMGFINDIRFLLGKVAPARQSLFFSATMDEKVKGLVHSFLNEPVTVSVKTGETSDFVEQDVVRYDSEATKLDKLHDVLISQAAAKILVFDETKRSVERLSRELVARGFSADALHGGKTQGQRQRALNAFRDNKVNILVATDVAARGIDIADITHVINYTTPNTYDDYTHRIGRAGRAGRTGYALTFVCER